MKVRNLSALLLLFIFCITGFFIILIFAEITDQSWNFIDSMQKKSMEEKNLKNMGTYIEEREKEGKMFLEIVSNYYQTLGEINSIRQDIREEKISSKEFKFFSAMFYVNPELRDLLLSEKK